MANPVLSPAPCPRAQLSGDVGLSWEPVELIVVGGGTACLPPDDQYSHLLIEIGCPEVCLFFTLHKVL